MPRPPSGRREQIGRAALSLVSTGGLHALTHRAVDAALSYPAGTTSYYARTRRELVTLAVEQLAEQLTSSPLVGDVRIDSDDDAVDLLTSVVSSLIEHDGATQLARLVLVIDLRDDPELNDLLHARSESIAPVDAFVAGVMSSLGIIDAPVHTRSLLALIDGLIYNALTSEGSTPVRPAIEVFWAGLPRHRAADLAEELLEVAELDRRVANAS